MTVTPDNIVDGIFLFILVGFSNYIYRIIPNQLEDFIFSYVFTQHILMLLLINFSVELVDNLNQSPLDNFYNSFIIYLFYIIFAKCGTWVSVILLLILTTLFFMTNERSYRGYPEKYLEKEIEIISYIACGLLGLSSIWTLIQGYRTNPKFNPIYFYFNITDNNDDYKNIKYSKTKIIKELDG